MIIKVTALTNCAVNDPVGIETTSTYGNPIIQLKRGDYREYDLLDQQGTRMLPVLEAARVKGLLDYEVVRTSDNPSYFTVSFDFTNVTGDILVGKAFAGMVAVSTLIRIITPFDGGTTITVGDVGDTSRLAEAADNFPSVIGDYETRPHHRYTAETEMRVYFPTGAPSVGEGEVTIYLADQ